MSEKVQLYLIVDPKEDVWPWANKVSVETAFHPFLWDSTMESIKELTKDVQFFNDCCWKMKATQEDRVRAFIWGRDDGFDKHGFDFSDVTFYIDAIHLKSGVVLTDVDGILDFFEQ